MKDRIAVVEGDITRQHVDAIVNAANNSLLGGGGVDGAIHRVAGPALLEECRTLHGCETGQAKITKGYKLPARFVIHTVGPIWHGNAQVEDQLLKGCYHNSLALAGKHGIKTIAFPLISTGAYRFPMDRAAGIAITEVRDFLAAHASIEKVVFVCYGREAFELYEKKLNELLKDGP